MDLVAVLEALARIEAKVDASTRRSDERHEETKRELKELRAEIKLLRANDELHQGAVKMAEERIRVVEDRVAKLEAEHHRVKRATDEGDEAQRAALMSAMNIVQQQQEKLREDFIEAQEATAAKLGGIVAALADVRLPRWLRIALAIGAAFGAFVAGIVAGLVSHGVIKF